MCYQDKKQNENEEKSEEKPRSRFVSLSDFVRMKGLEPPRRETPDPKSGAATNYATSAFLPSAFGNFLFPVAASSR